MRSNRLILLLAGLAVIAYVIFSSLFVITARQQAIVTRFGEITRIHTKPGVYFKIPTDFIESVQIVENRLLHYDLADIVVQVKGGKFYNVDAFVTYRIDDLVKFRETVQGSLLVAERRIDTRFNSALRQVYGLRDFNAALSDARTEMMKETRDLMHADMQELGIDVVDVRVLRTDLTAQVSAQTYDRMKAERLAEAAQLRAIGQQKAQAIRAVADRQAIEIVASANQESEIKRGEGDAERSRIFAEAFGRDPEFYAFYRSLQSYRSALKGSDTSMVLSPNSEFFDFFGKGSDVPETVLQALSASGGEPVLESNGAADSSGADQPVGDQPSGDQAAVTAPPAGQDAPAADSVSASQ